jgi:predicted MFS family arabinose efflux permease
VNNDAVKSDATLIWCVAIGQTISWGTLFSVFPLFVAPLEFQFGWSRAEVNAGLTLALLVGGLAAVPVGRMVDRRGGRQLMALGSLGGSLVLLALAAVDSLPVFWALWTVMGLVQATALWGPAMALVVGTARNPPRAIAGITFVTGFSTTLFVPIGAALIEALGWRGAWAVLAVIQAVPGLLIWWLLPPDPLRPATAPSAGFRLWEVMRRPAFLGLTGCFAAHAFIATGLGAHAIPLFRERGLPEASVLLLVALHGPFQVAARAALFGLGERVTMRGVGRLATLLTPLGMLALALAPAEFVWLLPYVLAWAVADGLITIVRSAGVAEILGREGFGVLTGALSAAAMLPRTLAPVLIALLWEGLGGYDFLPWLLAGLGVVSVTCFALAAAARSPA